MSEESNQSGSRATPAILLVDDIPANLRVLYESLCGRNYKLFIANGGEQALEVAHKSHPDLILLDIMMPDMDGFEVCRRLKQDPVTAGIAIIFLSALDDAADKIRGLELGAVDYVTKPFHPDEVAARVETHCKILRLEQELANRNRQLELVRDRILSSMAEGIVGLDADGRVSFVNPAAERILGVAAQGILARELSDWEPPTLRQTISRVLLKPSEVSVDELTLPRPDASTVPIELHIAPICEGERINGAVLVLRDLSERRQVEAKLHRTSDQLRESHSKLRQAQMQLFQAAKLESVGRLAAGVAHEVKNPLAIIQLGLDYLEASLEHDPVATEVRHDMLHAVLRADTVVRGLLDFSRERTLDLRPQAINRILEESLKLVRHELTQRNIKLETALSEGLPERRFDTDKMQQVFLNIFMNAMHAMEHGGVLRVSSALIEVDDADLGSHAQDAGFSAGDRLIRIVIEDSGPGIKPEDLSKLFDPYFTTKRQGEGTGLGLSVTRNIVTLHEGSIDLDNRGGGGASAVLLFKPDDKNSGDKKDPVGG
jgi:two-component system, LuxR family, sensor kinase FixL